MKKPHQKVAYLSRISVVSEIFPYCPTAQKAEIMFPNVAYRATVYRTGSRAIYQIKGRIKDFKDLLLNPLLAQCFLKTSLFFSIKFSIIYSFLHFVKILIAYELSQGTKKAECVFTMNTMFIHNGTVYIRTVSSQLLICSGTFVSFLVGMGHKSSVPSIAVLLCPNGP